MATQDRDRAEIQDTLAKADTADTQAPVVTADIPAEVATLDIVDTLAPADTQDRDIADIQEQLHLLLPLPGLSNTTSEPVPHKWIV